MEKRDKKLLGVVDPARDELLQRLRAIDPDATLQITVGVGRQPGDVEDHDSFRDKFKDGDSFQRTCGETSLR